MFKTLSAEQIESLDNILEKLMQGCYEEDGKNYVRSDLLIRNGLIPLYSVGVSCSVKEC